MKLLIVVLFLCSSLHGCGIALVRLNKPLAYYQEKYADAKWGLFKLLVLMDKQRNRGQDGAGVAIVDEQHNTIFIDKDLSFDALSERCAGLNAGTLLLGHLRYGTSGSHELKQCQPFIYKAEDIDRTFAFAGNFNLTNTKEILGAENQQSDTYAILKTLSESIDNSRLLAFKNAACSWDGGYVLCQVYANGDALIGRDPNGIRPGYYFQNEEIFAAASERAALLATFEVDEECVHPIPPGHILHFSSAGELLMEPLFETASEKSCVFERIYFSKGTDPEIYQERKELGRQLASRVWKAIEEDLAHTVFTYVPNSSQAAFLGLLEQVDQLHREKIKRKLLDKAPLEEIHCLLKQQVRNEMLITKNQKMRTFISPDTVRSKQISQLYEVTQKVVMPCDTLVVVDDSIVRGTTLRESLMKKLMSLNPKKILIVSSAPPVYFPDCYGIDMSQIGRFVAFQAAVEIFKEKEKCPPSELNQIYAASTLDDIERKVAELITPEDREWKGEVQVIYQTLEGLNQAIPSACGNWVFTGQYPTDGGLKVLQTSFANWLNHIDSRSY